MTIEYFPFDSGAGANSYEERWYKMARLWRQTGVIPNALNSLEPYADSTGMQVKIKSGVAWMEGHFFGSDAEEVQTIDTADATNPRIDLVVVRLNRATNVIGFAVVKGTAAASPAVPSLTQTETVYELALATVAVGAGVTTIAAENLADRRTMSYAEGPSPLALILALS